MNNFVYEINLIDNEKLSNLLMKERNDISSDEIKFYKLELDNKKFILELEGCEILEINNKIIVRLNDDQYEKINLINEYIKNKLELELNKNSNLEINNDVKFNSIIKNFNNQKCLKLNNKINFDCNINDLVSLKISMDYISFMIKELEARVKINLIEANYNEIKNLLNDNKESETSEEQICKEESSNNSEESSNLEEENNNSKEEESNSEEEVVEIKKTVKNTKKPVKQIKVETKVVKEEVNEEPVKRKRGRPPKKKL